MAEEDIFNREEIEYTAYPFNKDGLDDAVGLIPTGDELTNFAASTGAGAIDFPVSVINLPIRF